jgi:hypothetical protein
MASDVITNIARTDWSAIGAALDDHGYAVTPAILAPRECAELIALYDHRDRFRSRVDMARLRYGLGEYKYFAAPLPPLVAAMRSALYDRLQPIASAWMRAIRLGEGFPPRLDDFLDVCHRAGQYMPTPLMLRYDAGGYNCMHQDLYGEIFFPIQATVLLSRRETDFDGGEFILVEQRPRAQSRAAAITLERGQGIIFTTRYRPHRGPRGYSRVNVRHGVSTLARGRRFSLGIIFHDAR